MKKWETIREFIMITFATVIVAAAVFFFLMPSHVSVGSISGLAIVLGNFVPLKISAITFILNMFLLVLGFCLDHVAAHAPLYLHFIIAEPVF